MQGTVMRKVHPLSLSQEVITLLNQFPRGERSRRADEVLRVHLKSKSTVITPLALDETHIRGLIRQVLAEQQSTMCTQEIKDESEEAITLEAITQILRIRDFERDEE